LLKLVPVNHMITRYTIIISVFFLHAATSSLSQPGPESYSVKKFTTENGLSHDYVHWITQDKTGFLWIATWDGLNRFDGYEFKNYYHQPNETNTLPFFAIDKVLVDSLNNVWVISQARPLVRYDRASDSFIREYFSSIADSVIADVAICSGHELWIVDENYLLQYNPVTHKSKTFTLVDEKGLHPFIFNLYPQIVTDNLRNIWIIDWRSNEYLIYQGQWTKDSMLVLHPCSVIPLNNFKSSLIRNVIGNFDIFQSVTGNTWLFCKYGLYLLDPEEEKFNPFTGPVDPEEFSEKPFYAWSDDFTGLHMINTIEKKHIHIHAQPGSFITSIYSDRFNTIWSGDLNEFREGIGLNRYLPVHGFFRHYLTDKDISDNRRLVFPMLKDRNGDIWAGTRHSENIFRIGNNGQVTETPFIVGYQGKNHPMVRSMFCDTSGIWMGCTGNYLIRHDFKTGKFTPVFIRAKRSSGEELNLGVHNILPFGNDLIINTREGIFTYRIASGKIEMLYKYRKEMAYCLVEDGTGGYWIGMNNNIIIHLDNRLRETGSYRLGKGLNNVEHICPGDSNDVWVAIMGGGLGHLYPDSGKFRVYTTADGLANNTLYSIVKDKRGNLWMATNQGMSRFNPTTKLFRNYGKAEGLYISEFNSDSYFLAPDGEVFFGGVGGMVSFYTDSIDENPDSGGRNPLIITDFKVSGIPRYFQKSVYESDSVILAKGDNNFQISFVCLDFRNPEKIRYRYKLAEDGSQWTETNFRNRNINYTNLSPGAYQIQLEATNYNGDWNLETSLIIIIPHFFYETWWFRIFVLMTGILLVSLLIVLYFRQIRLKARQKEGELRLESLRGQMNPHFIFNSLNSINYFISKNDKYSANHYIADFSRLIRSILHNLSMDYIPLEKEIESLSDYLKLEHLRFSDKFYYSLNYDALDGMNNLLVFPGMVQPFVENAIWHGVRGLEERIGKVRIELIPRDEHSVQCIIEDDGVGRKLSEIFKSNMPGKKSRGIGIVLERLRIINDLNKSDLKVIIEDLYPEKEETGTRVIIDIPMKLNV
jgi:streptogramin lyase